MHRAYERGVQEVRHTWAWEDESTHAKFFCDQVQNWWSSFLTAAQKDLRFKHWGAKLASCPGSHLTLLCPYSYPLVKYLSEVLRCAVWVVVPANKLLLQEINQFIGIELLTSSFLKNLVLSPNFQGGEIPISTTLRTPMFWCTISSKLFAWVQCKSTPIIVTHFAFTCSVTMLTCSRNYRKPFPILGVRE